MQFFAIVMLLFTADPVRVQLDWKGGDLASQAGSAIEDSGLSSPNDSVSPGTDAHQSSTVLPIEAESRVDGRAVSLKSAIAEYKRNGGVKFFVRGKTDAQHVVEDHGWTYAQIRGLSLDEIQYLHGASHTGKLSPESFFAARRVEQPSDAPPAAANAFPSPCILKFEASWCGPCHSRESKEIVAWLKASNWTVKPIDIDRNADLMRQFNVTQIPTYVVIRNGAEAGRYTGVSRSSLLAVLRNAVE